MPTAATRSDGPQAVAPYNYPHGAHDVFGAEWVYRQARVTDANDTPDAIHALAVSDGGGGLPIEGQPREIEAEVPGIALEKTSVTLAFYRDIGGPGPYVACPASKNPPPRPGQPHTFAKR